MRVAPSAAPALVDERVEAAAGAAVLASTVPGCEGPDDVELVVTAELNGFELPRGGIDLKDHLSAIEIGLIRQALEEADGTVAEAARLLRMRRTTLVEKLRKYRLSA
jgi:sigma-54 specific flagellar transcriptional regulator A